MLSRKNRLPYAELGATGYKTIRTPWFSLKIRTNELPYNRIGVVIGVAAEKGAVRRNFWKRQAKMILNKLPAGHSGGGKDFVVLFSKKIKELDKKQFAEELLRTISN